MTAQINLYRNLIKRNLTKQTLLKYVENFGKYRKKLFKTVLTKQHKLS